MTQALYAHRNNKTIKISKIKKKTISDLKSHCRAIVTKPAWYRHKNTHRRWNTIEDPGINQTAKAT
jgi:hypothetical protein